MKKKYEFAQKDTRRGRGTVCMLMNAYVQFNVNVNVMLMNQFYFLTEKVLLLPRCSKVVSTLGTAGEGGGGGWGLGSWGVGELGSRIVEFIFDMLC